MSKSSFFKPLTKKIAHFLTSQENRVVKARQKVLMLFVVGSGIFLVFMMIFSGEGDPKRIKETLKPLKKKG